MARGKLTDDDIDDVEPAKAAPVVVSKPAVQPPKVEMRQEMPTQRVIDVRRAGFQIVEGVFRLQRYVPDAVYVDAINNRQVGSIGRNVFDNRIEAAIDSRYSNDPNWDCLFSR